MANIDLEILETNLEFAEDFGFEEMSLNFAEDEGLDEVLPLGLDDSAGTENSRENIACPKCGFVFFREN